MKRKHFGVSSSLSRGLSETISIAENLETKFRNSVVPLTRIAPDPDNPRHLKINKEDILQSIEKSDFHYETKVEEFEKIKQLAESIQKSGLINPITLYKEGETYKIVAGERRYLAYVYLKKAEIEARIFNEKPSEIDLKLVQWYENTAREDLTLYERLNNVAEIVAAFNKKSTIETITPAVIQHLIGISKTQAFGYACVLNSASIIMDAIRSGQINNLDKAAVIAGVKDEILSGELIVMCQNGASIKQLKEHIKSNTAKPIAVVGRVQEKRGRPSNNILLGKTNNPKVAETIVHSVLGLPIMKKHQVIFSKIDWEDTKEAKAAFHKFIELLEESLI